MKAARLHAYDVYTRLTRGDIVGRAVIAPAA